MSDLGRTTIAVPDDVAAEFKALKQRRKYRYLLLKLDSDAFSLGIAETGAPDSTLEQFLKCLSDSESRYAVYDHPYTTPDGRKVSKLYFLSWTPVAASGKSKMFYTSQRRALDAVFTGVEDVQLSNKAEIRRLLGPKAAVADDEDEAWDPDA